VRLLRTHAAVPRQRTRGLARQERGEIGGGVSPRPKSDSLPAGITRRASSGYQAQVWSPIERKRLSRTFQTVAAAKAWKRDTEQALARGVGHGANAPLLRDAAERWLADAASGVVRTRSGDRYKPATLRGYEQALRSRIVPELGHLRLSEVRRGALGRLARAMLADGMSASTVRNALLPLRSIFRDALASELVYVNPCVGLELPAVRGRRDRVVQPADASLQIATLPERDRALWATAMYAGLRRGELMALRWSDVDLARRRLRVERNYDPVARAMVEPKSRAGLRVVPVPDVLAGLLEAHRARSRPERQPLVFARSSLAGRVRLPDGPFNDTAVSARAKRAWLSQGIAPVTLHECRHTYASLLIAARLSPKEVQTYLGHSSIAITFDRYGHLFAGGEAASADRLQAYLDGAEADRVAAAGAAVGLLVPAATGRTE
jgi:integrase